MSESDWKPITENDPPHNSEVMTKIDDRRGWRNDAILIRHGNLWFVDDMSMYVYYRPTHYRELTGEERGVLESRRAARESGLSKLTPQERHALGL